MDASNRFGLGERNGLSGRMVVRAGLQNGPIGDWELVPHCPKRPSSRFLGRQGVRLCPTGRLGTRRLRTPERSDLLKGRVLLKKSATVRQAETKLVATGVRNAVTASIVACRSTRAKLSD